MEQNQERRIDLANEVSKLNESVSELTGVARDSIERDKQHRKTLTTMKGLFIAQFVTLLLLSFIIIRGLDSQSDIRDCILPDGQCFQRNSASTAEIINSAALRNERERLETEIFVSQNNGLPNSEINVQLRTQRLGDIQRLLDESNQRLAEIRESR